MHGFTRLGRAATALAVVAWMATRIGAAPGDASATGTARLDSTYWTANAVPADSQYRSPIRLLLSGDGRWLYAACEGTGDVRVVDTRSRKVTKMLAVGGEPFGLALSPDQRRLWVTLRRANQVVELDLAAGRVARRAATGDDPHDLAVSRDGQFLFVANLGTDDLSVLRTADLSEVKRLPMGRAPFGLALSPDGGILYVSSQYSIPVPFRTPPVLELTIVDVASQRVRERRSLPSTVIGQGIAVSPDGHFAATALELPKNLVPETQVYQGWMVTHGFALTETALGGRTALLLLDEPNLYYADPYGIGFSPDGRHLYVSSSGADVLTVVDLQSVYALLRVKDGRIGATDEELRRHGRDLGLSSQYVAGRVRTGANPKGLAVSPDGRRVYVAARLADRVEVVDAGRLETLRPIDLGGPEVLTVLRRGAQLFNYASISFQRQLSCNTCHPEYSVDGLIYDIAADGGMGHNLVDNMSMRGVGATPPYKWRGKNPTLQRQEGPRAAQLFFRSHGFDPEENEAITRFLESIPPRPNRYRRADGSLNEFQRLGKRLFERAYDNQGRYIPIGNRCITCHPGPLGTDRKVHEVGSRNTHDLDGDFDTPFLVNVYERPPFMHDGRCYSLEEIWTRFNPYDTHGVTNDMSKDQLNALIEYTKTF